MTEKRKARLEEMLAEAETRLKRVGEDLDVPLDPDFSEQATEAQDDEVLEGEGKLLVKEIISIKRALARIEDGTYGECFRCGGEISSGRLDARPEAALCIRCASAEAPQ